MNDEKIASSYIKSFTDNSIIDNSDNRSSSYIKYSTDSPPSVSPDVVSPSTGSIQETGISENNNSQASSGRPGSPSTSTTSANPTLIKEVDDDDDDLEYFSRSDLTPDNIKYVKSIIEKPTENLMEELWKLWKIYIDYFVVGNHELKKLIFHSFIGVILTYKGWKYVVSGDNYHSPRYHVFMIQPSGTGKSQIMKAYNNILEYLGVPSRYTTHDNEAYLVGTTEEDATKGKMKAGALSTLYSLAYDEGQILLSKNVPFLNVEVLTAQLQGVMDEPGRIPGKGMRSGSVAYPSNTTILAGSYMFEEFKQTMLQKGFLQRMRLHFVTFSSEEKDKITAGIELMKLQKNPRKIQFIREKMKELVAKIPQCKDINLYKKFDKTAVLNWIKEKMAIKKQYIEEAYTGEKQETLETFFNRIHLIVDKIACQRAILLNKDIIDMEDIHAGRDEAVKHIESVMACFDTIKTKIIVAPIMERKQTVCRLIRKHDGLNLGELATELRVLRYNGKWDLGSSKTISFIRELVDTNILREQLGDKNSKKFFLNQKI